MHWYRWQDDTLLLQLHVQTRTHHDEFKGLLDDRLCPIPKQPGNAGFPDWFLKLSEKSLKDHGNF